MRISDWSSDVCSSDLIDTLYAVAAESLPARNTADWLAALAARDIPCSQVPDLPSLLDDPHLAEIGFFDVPAGYPAGIERAIPQPVLFEGVAPAPDAAPRSEERRVGQEGVSPCRSWGSP